MEEKAAHYDPYDEFHMTFTAWQYDKALRRAEELRYENEIAADLDAARTQPIPHGTGPEIAPLVIADIEARVRLGEGKYGERLRSRNGRNALLDAYQEQLDGAMYLRQLLAEQHRKVHSLRHARKLLRSWVDTFPDAVGRDYVVEALNEVGSVLANGAPL